VAHASALGATTLVADSAISTGATGQFVFKTRASSSVAHPFASTPLRHLLFAVRETAAHDLQPEPGRQYLRDSFGQAYWGRREGFVNLLDWLAALGNAVGMAEWATDSEAARLLAGRLRNDHA